MSQNVLNLLHAITNYVGNEFFYGIVLCSFDLIFTWKYAVIIEPKYSKLCIFVVVLKRIPIRQLSTIEL